MNPSSLTESTTIVANENALATTIDGESVILHKEAGKYYGLNEVGTFIWKLIQQPRSVEEVCQEILSEYDVARETCRNDVKNVVVDLAEKDLVHLDDP